MRGYGYERPQEQSPPEEQSYTPEAPPPQLPPVQQNYYQPDYGRRKTLDEVETVQDLADYLIPEAINAVNQQVAEREANERVESSEAQARKKHDAQMA